MIDNDILREHKFLPLSYMTAFSPVCKLVLIFLESVKRGDQSGRGGEKEEDMAMQSYVLKPRFMKIK